MNTVNELSHLMHYQHNYCFTAVFAEDLFLHEDCPHLRTYTNWWLQLWLLLRTQAWYFTEATKAIASKPLPIALVLLQCSGRNLPLPQNEARMADLYFHQWADFLRSGQHWTIVLGLSLRTKRPMDLDITASDHLKIELTYTTFLLLSNNDLDVYLHVFLRECQY